MWLKHPRKPNREEERSYIRDGVLLRVASTRNNSNNAENSSFKLHFIPFNCMNVNIYLSSTYFMCLIFCLNVAIYFMRICLFLNTRALLFSSLLPENDCESARLNCLYMDVLLTHKNEMPKKNMFDVRRCEKYVFIQIQILIKPP